MVEDYNDMNREYVAALVPDKLKLAELIKRAKGESRTMVEFAEKCGVITASSFSRIMHGNMTKPLSRELINAIFTNAVPTARITYEDLMRANGMIPADSPAVKNLDDNISNRKFLEDQKNEVIIKNIFHSEMIERGIFFRQIPTFFDEEKELKFGLRTKSNYSYELQGFEPKIWNIVIYTASRYADFLENETVQRKYAKEFIFRQSHLFLRDAWEPDSLANIKNSFIFINKQGFEAVKKILEDVKVNSIISLLFLDLEKNEVVEEYFIPRKGKKTPDSLFDMPKLDYGRDTEEDSESGMYDEEV